MLKIFRKLGGIVNTMLLIALILCNVSVNGSDIYRKSNQLRSLFALSSQNITEGLKKSNFKFPNYNYAEQDLYYKNVFRVAGLNGKKDSTFNFNIKVESEKIGFFIDKQVDNVQNSEQILFNMINYIDKIEHYRIYIKIRGIQQFFLLKNVKVSKAYTFQQPLNIEINQNLVLTDSSLVAELQSQKIFIDEIKIAGKKSSKNAQFIIGKLEIIGKKEKYINPKEWKSIVKPIKSSILIDESHLLSDNAGFSFKVEIEDSLKECDKVKEIRTTVESILDQYPNYYFKDILKDSVLKMHDLIPDSSLDFYYQQVKKIFLSFEDLHFRLDYGIKRLNNQPTSGVRSITSPFYLYEILGNAEVSAVFDTTLTSIKPGFILKSINGINSQDVINKFCSKKYGSSLEVRKQKVFQSFFYLLYKEFGDSIQFNFADYEGNNIAIILTEKDFIDNRNIHISSNFRNPNKYFFNKKNNIAYVKLGELTDDKVIPFFLSYKDSINETRGIIVDLRNNVGSDNSILYIMSLFLKEPYPCFQTSIENVFLPTTIGKNYETFVVKPNIVSFAQPVVFIQNARTTCGGEILIEVLRKANNYKVIGTTSSAGAAQYMKRIELPDSKKYENATITFYSACTYVNGSNIDEIKGIKPDILTYYSSFRDLAPYGDKLKELAYKYILEFNVR